MGMGGSPGCKIGGGKGAVREGISLDKFLVWVRVIISRNSWSTVGIRVRVSFSFTISIHLNIRYTVSLFLLRIDLGSISRATGITGRPIIIN